MKKLILALSALMVLSSVPEAGAESKNITTISTQQVVELESMHQAATDLLLKNDFHGAVRAYSDILLAEPDDETAYTGLGQIYMVLGQLQKAHEAFKNALHINPNNEVALLGIQKIMDPDGVEGMTSPNLEEMPIPDPAFAPAAGVEKRLGAVSPVVKKIKPSKQPMAKRFRLGLLNAQRIQMCLRNAGVYAGPVNGMVGHRTQQAIKKFQKMRGFKETGTVNSVTWQALLPYL